MNNLSLQNKFSKAFPPGFLLCPACSSCLQTENNTIKCPNGHAYDVIDGIPVLTKKTSYHFLTPTKEQIEKTSVIMDAKGFLHGMDYLAKDMSARESVEFNHYMMGEDRAAWKILLPDLEKKRVLDYGCGWGNIATALARSAEVVYGMDLSLQRVRFGTRRAQHEGLGNLHFVAGGDLDRLPFPDGYFDIVILNGILEWIPTSRGLDDTATGAQLSFLKELSRITKPNGTICLAIENRFGLKYFWGTRDEHSRLRFITILPRLLADMYSKAKRGIPFREYTHSVGAYKKLLAKSDFSHAQAFVPFPSYRYYDVISPYENTRGMSRFFGAQRKINRWSAKITEHLPFFANAFFIVAGKQKPQGTSALDRVFQADARYVFDPVQPLRILGTGAALVFGRDQKENREVVVKIPLIPSAVEANAKAHENLGFLQNSKEVPAWFKALLAQPLRQFQAGAHPSFIQSRLPGVTGAELAVDPNQKPQVISAAVEMLARLHRETAREITITDQLFEGAILPFLQNALERVRRNEEIAVKSVELETRIRQLFVGKTMPVVLCHGDFWLKNILFDRNSLQPTGVLDWDRLHFPGLPVFDLISLLFMSRKRSAGFQEALLDVLSEIRNPSATIQDYLAPLKLQPDHLKAIAAVYYLHRFPEEKRTVEIADLDFISKLLA